MGLISKATRVVKQAVSKANNKGNVWDMSSKDAREAQVKRDYEYAKTQKGETTERFVELDNYYNNKHYTAQQIAALVEKHNIPFTPPVLPDAYIQVESQIEGDVPDFEFKGRDDDLDGKRAKIREQVVKFICYNNHLDDMNPDQERCLGKLGNAFWKVGFDDRIQGPGFIGDIVLGDPDPANIFPDPAAYDIDDCEYLIYAYRIHRRAAERRWGRNVIDQIQNDANHGDTEIYESATRDIYDDTLQAIEYWYRDDEGDIACTIQVGGIEVQYIPKYWVNTRKSGNRSYPFIKYCKTPNAKSFWDRGDIDAIKDLIDAGDREFMNAILNSAMLGNDIILEEEGAFADGFEPHNMPGARWKMKPQKLNAVKRLGGVTNNTNSLNMISFIHDKIEETNGNFATKGAEVPSRVNTASGLAMIREDREKRGAPKKIDRVGGFRRLYELIDWTALEFYNTDRIILIRGKTKEDPAQAINFNSENFKQPVVNPQNPMDFMMSGEDDVLSVQEYYYPRIDCEINVGQGIAKSPALTLQATQELSKIPVTPQNVELVCSMVDQMGLNDANQIKDNMRRAVQQLQQPPGGAEQGIETGAENPPTPQGPATEEIHSFLDTLPPQIEQALVEQIPEDKLDIVVQALMQLPPEKVPGAIKTLLGGGGTVG